MTDEMSESTRLMAQKLAERMVAQAADMAQNQAEMVTAMSNQITFNAVKGTLEGDITPQQYHAGIDKLREALGIHAVQDEDVFALAAREIKRLRRKQFLAK